MEYLPRNRDDVDKVYLTHDKKLKETDVNLIEDAAASILNVTINIRLVTDNYLDEQRKVESIF